VEKCNASKNKLVLNNKIHIQTSQSKKDNKGADLSSNVSHKYTKLSQSQFHFDD